MAQNEGKKLEEDIKKSVPQECFYYRFKDNAASFSGGDNTRFTSSNIADCMVMTEENLFILELKSHKGTSIPFSCIRKNQIEEMSKIEHKRIKAYFVFNFRDKEKTYAVKSHKVKVYMQLSERKSIPIKWCEENGIEIIGTKKKIRYNYDLKKFFEDATKKTCTVKQVKDYMRNI